MSVLRAKPGVLIVPDPGGFRIIAELVMTANVIGQDITITSGADGEHSGADDPHHIGRAFDIRTHDLNDPKLALTTLMMGLGTPVEADGGYVTDKFFGWLENAGTDNEHIHVQVRKGVIYQ